jgi:transposase
MSGAYSEDLRVRLVRAVRAGMSARAAARLFEVSESSGVKWAQRFRKTGSVKPNAIRGHRHSPLDGYAAWLLGLIEAEPDITLEEIGRRLSQEKGLSVGTTSIWRFFERHQISFKKKRARGRARPRRRSQRP